MQAKRHEFPGINLWPILFFALLMACGKDGEQAPMHCNYARAADVYVYPVVPGTPEWVALNTTEARWEACQIPQDKRKAMSTAGLIDSWSDFPFNNDIFRSANYQNGIDFLMAHFSGLQELCLRSDAGIKLIERYQQMQPACVKTYTIEKSRGDFILSFPPIELLLAQDTILNKLSLPQKKDLVKEALIKYHDKKQYPEQFSLVAGRAFPLLICMRTLKNAGYQPMIEALNASQILVLFDDRGLLFTDNPNAPEIQTIVKHAENFIR